MTKKNHDIVEVQVTVKHETENAYLVNGDGFGGVWVPKSQCQFTPDDVVTEGILQLPEWLAIEKRLV